MWGKAKSHREFTENGKQQRAAITKQSPVSPREPTSERMTFTIRKALDINVVTWKIKSQISDLGKLQAEAQSENRKTKTAVLTAMTHQWRSLTTA